MYSEEQIKENMKEWEVVGVEKYLTTFIKPDGEEVTIRSEINVFKEACPDNVGKSILELVCGIFNAYGIPPKLTIEKVGD